VVVLAAIATRTKQIKLGTAVTILSTDDPVRVYQRFSTLNAVSQGRSEVILGRGSSPNHLHSLGFLKEMAVRAYTTPDRPAPPRHVPAVRHSCEGGLVSGGRLPHAGPEPLDQLARRNVLVCCSQAIRDVVIDL
jgi:hypothetical protein